MSERHCRRRHRPPAASSRPLVAVGRPSLSVLPLGPRWLTCCAVTLRCAPLFCSCFLFVVLFGQARARWRRPAARTRRRWWTWRRASRTTASGPSSICRRQTGRMTRRNANTHCDDEARRDETRRDERAVQVQRPCGPQSQRLASAGRVTATQHSVAYPHLPVSLSVCPRLLSRIFQRHSDQPHGRLHDGHRALVESQRDAAATAAVTGTGRRRPDRSWTRSGTVSLSLQPFATSHWSLIVGLRMSLAMPLFHSFFSFILRDLIWTRCSRCRSPPLAFPAQTLNRCMCIECLRVLCV